MVAAGCPQQRKIGAHTRAQSAVVDRPVRDEPAAHDVLEIHPSHDRITGAQRPAPRHAIAIADQVVDDDREDASARAHRCRASHERRGIDLLREELLESTPLRDGGGPASDELFEIVSAHAP